MDIAARMRRVLTWSERQALGKVLSALPPGESRVVLAQVADVLDVSRSLIVNALRLCEAAGLVEVRSMGQRGSHVRVLDREVLVRIVAD